MPIHLLWLAPFLVVAGFISLAFDVQWGTFFCLAVAVEACSLAIHMLNHRLQKMPWPEIVSVLHDAPWAFVNIVLITIFVAGTPKNLPIGAVLIALLGLAICSLHIHARRHHDKLWTAHYLVEKGGLVLAAISILIA